LLLWSKDGGPSQSQLPNLHQKSLRNKKGSRLFKVTYKREIAPAVFLALAPPGGRNETFAPEYFYASSFLGLKEILL
jgi:hypothetical protein